MSLREPLGQQVFCIAESGVVSLICERKLTGIADQADSDREQTLVSSIAEAPYDGHHSSRASPDAMSIDDEEQNVPVATRP